MTVPSPLIRASRKTPCLVCRSVGWPCSYAADRGLRFCGNVSSTRRSSDGVTWLHFDDSICQTHLTPKAIPIKPIEQRRSAPAHLHVVYTALLQSLTLSDDHQVELLGRGLSLSEIQRLQFKSTPKPGTAAEIARELSLRFDLCGLPGFFQASGDWRMVSTAPGFFVPYRDEQGRIEGLQIRRWPHTGGNKYIWLSSKDKLQGASSGSPIHFAKGDLLAGAAEVVITEGALKADVAAYLSQTPVIGVAGVNSFGEGFSARLKSSFPKLRQVILAYDCDFADNRSVYQALTRLTAQLERAYFQVRLRTWPPPAKGYDDYLLSQARRQEVAA